MVNIDVDHSTAWLAVQLLGLSKYTLLLLSAHYTNPLQ